MSTHEPGRKHRHRRSTDDPEATGTRGSEQADLPAVPPVLPHVVITATDAGTLDVTVDGKDLPPRSPKRPWTRARFGELLDTVTDERRVPVRIEVHETDGTAFTDIVHAARHRPEPPATASPPATPKKAKPTRHVEVTATGFVPGEDIAIAIITGTAEADGQGRARAVIARAGLREAGEVVLVGRVSGAVHVEALS
ncbi:hypothetical protein [Brevibacterium sp. HMSC063G07]|uniref:hypothetical protein n=1 Tax=Brevibacterium sp. HMSC063G07 TaxID=1739261 RepID=UPI000A84E5E6|nr:hypothetical protein [Brevibacterium sp. HMSC063G07]